MEEKRTVMINKALKYGFVFAVATIMFSIIEKTVTLNEDLPIILKSLVKIIYGIVSVIIITLLTRKYRIKALDNIITFGRAFQFGVLIVASSVVILMVFEYIYLTYIDTEYLAKSFEITKQHVYEVLEDNPAFEEYLGGELEKISENLPTAFKTAIGKGANNIIWGLIISMISAAICTKKENIEFGK